MKIGQIISAIVLLAYGIWMKVIGLLEKEVMIILFILGAGSIGLGIYVLFNTKEDRIEQIKKRKGGKK